MKVAIVNTKGGVTKTTTAIHIANELALRDPQQRIIVADLDKQGSATEWADRAQDNKDPLPFQVEVSNIKRLARLADSLNPSDALIIDTPPGDSSIIQAAIEIADFVVIPTRPSGMDTSRVWETLPAISEDKLYAVLITFARLGTNLLRDTIATFEEQGVSRFDTIIPLREKIPAEYGQRPARDSAYADVVTEMMEAIA